MLKLKAGLLCLFAFFTIAVYAQISSLPSNLSGYRSADVTNDQLSQLTAYMKQNNINIQQVFDQLIARGMSLSEANSLKNRISTELNNVTSGSGIPADKPTTLPKQGVTEKRYLDTATTYFANPNPLKIFGLEIFNNGVIPSFESDGNMATPVGYIIGPGDEIKLNIYGYQEANYNLTVSPEGSITVPYIGIVYVAGLSVEQASSKIKNKLTTSGYSNLRTGLTKLNVSVGRIRSIKVTVLGEVKRPGTFTMPSLASAFNALYVSGGPNNIGSMRNIEIIRNGKVIDVLDIYDFLIKGDQTGNIQLRDQDVIRIPPYKIRVSVEGETKRTGLFEVKAGENFSDLLSYAGGFGDSAYTASVTAYKSTDTEKRIIDIGKEEFDSYKPSRSESFVVKKLVDRFTNRVSVKGAVYLPGYYQLTEGMTIKDLINKSQGLKEDAYKERGIIKREKSDLTQEYISFNPEEILNGNTSKILLQKNDEVSISSVKDLKDKMNVQIYGEVRSTGQFPYLDNMSLKDLILMAGGFTDAAIPQRIEISRRLNKDSFSVDNMAIAKVLDITNINVLNKNDNDVVLQPYDVVIVRKSPSFKEQVNVRVEGEVIYPGPYILRSKEERISDVISRAGGLTNQAYKIGGYLSRLNNLNLINQVNKEKVSKIQNQLKDSTNLVEEEVVRPIDQIALNLTAILANPGGKDDIIIENGDIITIPKAKMDVRISGEVLFPTRVVYDGNMNMKDYIGRAGGFTDNARKARVYILYPNGNAAKTSSFLFFRKFPKVTTGSEIIVPKQREVERRKLTTGEIVGISTAFTALTSVLIQLLR